jgi:hypothetical protein
VQPRRNEDLKLVGNGDGPAIKGLVVDATASQPVVDAVGPSVLAPPDVRCFKAKVGIIELDLKATEGAPVTPDRNHRRAEFRIASTAARAGI